MSEEQRNFYCKVTNVYMKQLLEEIQYIITTSGFALSYIHLYTFFFKLQKHMKI